MLKAVSTSETTVNFYEPTRLCQKAVIFMSMLVFWFAMQCELVGRYQRFEGTYCLQFQNVGTYPLFHLFHTALQPRSPTPTFPLTVIKYNSIKDEIQLE
jgi:hypothetical protein